MQIVIPTIASHPFLRLTLEAYRSTSPQTPISLIAGNKKTRSLRKIERAFPLRLVCLGRNHGFSYNVNRGLTMCDQDDIVIVSNDDLVMCNQHWREIVEEDLKDESIGAVGAVSNYVLNLQLADREGPEREIVPCLSFFWIAIPRRALDVVGLLDEEFGVGLCEDLDWTIRARKAGFKLLLDRRLFIWHWGSQTLKDQVPNIAEQDAKNRALLQKKHGDISWDL